MKLIEYDTLEDKSRFFTSRQTINTISEFNDLFSAIDKLSKKKTEKYVFRGVREAKYRLYSSFQRLWLTNELNKSYNSHQDVISKMISECANPKTILYKYYKRLGVICNDWLILSFLQHYGAATPLLDFSQDPKVALFFACLDCTFVPSNKEIDNYISIYYYKSVDVANGLAPSIYNLAKKKAERYSTYAGRDFWTSDLSFRKISEGEYKACIVPSYTNSSDINNGNKTKITEYAVSNLNLTAQEGQFICNFQENIPLEEILIKDDKKLLYCVDIHKNLLEYIIHNYLEGSMDNARKKYFVKEQDIACAAQRNLFLLSDLD